MPEATLVLLASYQFAVCLVGSATVTLKVGIALVLQIGTSAPVGAFRFGQLQSGAVTSNVVGHPFNVAVRVTSVPEVTVTVFPNIVPDVLVTLPSLTKVMV